MSYSRKNKLLRIAEIQEIVSKEKRKGVTQKWVYDHIIADRFLISFATFNNYLAVNAKKELKALEANEGSSLKIDF
jgi:hypothetical protein